MYYSLGDVGDGRTSRPPVAAGLVTPGGKAERPPEFHGRAKCTYRELRTTKFSLTGLTPPRGKPRPGPLLSQHCMQPPATCGNVDRRRLDGRLRGPARWQAAPVTASDAPESSLI